MVILGVWVARKQTSGLCQQTPSSLDLYHLQGCEGHTLSIQSNLQPTTRSQALKEPNLHLNNQRKWTYLWPGSGLMHVNLFCWTNQSLIHDPDHTILTKKFGLTYNYSCTDDWHQIIGHRHSSVQSGSSLWYHYGLHSLFLKHSQHSHISYSKTT